MLMGMMMRIKIKAQTTNPGKLQVMKDGGDDNDEKDSDDG